MSQLESFGTVGFLVSVSIVVASGCGSGPKVYHVSGQATFAGKPIPVGNIYFTPDGSKGNTGAAGWARIENGKYSTRSAGGSGALGGPTIVRIEGSDGVKIDEERTGGKPLFGSYETAVDLPKSTTTKDFDVPASAATAVPPGGQPVTNAGL